MSVFGKKKAMFCMSFCVPSFASDFLEKKKSFVTVFVPFVLIIYT